MQLDIRGRVAVVTGAGRGIGEALATRFAKEGARLALWERDPDTLRSVGEALAAATDIASCECDVADEASVERAMRKTLERFGRVDILVNNAGVAPSGAIDQMDVAMWDETFAVNVRGVFLTCRAVIPAMKQQRSGRILNASSFAAIIPSYAFAAYAASKAAVTTMTRVLAAELGPWNITVNAYAPGMVPTMMNRFAEAPETRQQQLLDTLAIRRWESTEDVAALLVFLASDQAGYVTGALIDVSGGKFAVQFPQLAHQAAKR